MKWQETRATIDGGFWHAYQLLVRDKVIPYQWKAMNDEISGAPKSHSVENFRIAAGRSNGAHEGMVFQDSDLSKWLEAVGNVLRTGVDGTDSMRAWAQEAVDLIAAAQQPDGYVNTYFTVKDPGQRFRNLRDAHELYCWVISSRRGSPCSAAQATAGYSPSCGSSPTSSTPGSASSRGRSGAIPVTRRSSSRW